MGDHPTDQDLHLKYLPGDGNSFSENAAKPTSYFPETQPRATRLPEVKVLQQETTEGDEEADNHTMTRMLEDARGRLLYVGDASNISFLQLLRMIVETVAGPCAFSLDPGRHRLVENTLNLSLENQLTYQLPTKETALVLVESFFVNVCPVLLALSCIHQT